MPAKIPSDIRARALALVARSPGHTVRARCEEARKTLTEEGFPLSLRTIQRWTTPQLIVEGPCNSRANRTKPSIVDNDENIDAVLELIEEKKAISYREIAARTGISKSSVYRIVKLNGFHLCK